MFKNVENFEAWIKETLKSDVYDFNAILDDVEGQYGSSGSPEYELSGFETKSGHPETYSYEVETHFFILDDGEAKEVSGENNDFDYAEQTFIF